MTWKLNRLKQCEKCPWKKSTNPHEIPNGYSVEAHRSLARTIAKAGELTGGDMLWMSCHEHDPGDAAACVGWLNHQANEGNNIRLRIALLSCANAHGIQLDGPQHESFEDTLPKEQCP